jgi:type VI secretion system protein VasD
MITHTTRHRALLFACAVALAASACGKGAPPPSAGLTITAADDASNKAPMTLSASTDSNPDEKGEAKPVVLRVYQLRATDRFLSADYDALFDEDGKILDREMISRNEFVLAPAEKQVIEVAVSRETRFVGVAAGIRDYRNAQWRQVIATPRSGLTIAVERDRVVISTPTK